MADDEQTPPPPLPSLAELAAEIKRARRKSRKQLREVKEMAARTAALFNEWKRDPFCTHKPDTDEVWSAENCMCEWQNRSGVGWDVCAHCWETKRDEGDDAKG
jgi:hypothetical protein